MKRRFVGRPGLQFDWSEDSEGRAKRPRVVADELDASDMRGKQWDIDEVAGHGRGCKRGAEGEEAQARRVKLRRSAVSRMPPLP